MHLRSESICIISLTINKKKKPVNLLGCLVTRETLNRPLFTVRVLKPFRFLTAGSFQKLARRLHPINTENLNSSFRSIMIGVHPGNNQLIIIINCHITHLEIILNSKLSHTVLYNLIERPSNYLYTWIEILFLLTFYHKFLPKSICLRYFG